jgi:D-glycerate 3-kinase
VDQSDTCVLTMQIGFSAPQGCGKTTLVFALDYLFKTTKKYIALLHLISHVTIVILILTLQEYLRKSATISVDDFYLTAEGQVRDILRLYL